MSEYGLKSSVSRVAHPQYGRTDGGDLAVRRDYALMRACFMMFILTEGQKAIRGDTGPHFFPVLSW